jgi:hypothetical protein
MSSYTTRNKCVLSRKKTLNGNVNLQKGKLSKFRIWEVVGAVYKYKTRRKCILRHANQEILLETFTCIEKSASVNFFFSMKFYKVQNKTEGGGGGWVGIHRLSMVQSKLWKDEEKLEICLRRERHEDGSRAGSSAQDPTHTSSQAHWKKNNI